MSKELYEKAIAFTKAKIKESIGIDYYIVQLVAGIEDLDTISNKMIKRLRDWYELHLPEFSRQVTDHKVFLRELKHNKQELMKKNNISISMGADFSDEELKSLNNLRNSTLDIFSFKDIQLEELDKLMNKHYPNMTTLAGSLIGGKLLKLAGSMKKLIEFPASTIQLLGAEKALFRHLKTGKKCPKYGILLGHPFVAESKDKSKAARKLADKISIAEKVDYFKGEFIGDELKSQLK
ncbi:NOP58 family protein [Candidatus Woesearchaeota archaeon]|nr:NOP58 family protein [Candidatus Woesearchaeota archaeon]